jgi:nucleolar MIF4G domain-containing protein 1
MASPQAAPAARERAALEEVFVKAARIPGLAVGIVYFLGKFVRPGAGDRKDGALAEWACEVALDTLRTGLDGLPGL